MDKLVKHGIRMLEIVEGENDFFRNDAKRQADIARAVYDTILRVQVLERKFDKDINVRNKDEPKTQTKTQNSNLTFEKRTMRDCYNCKRYETEDECIECHYEPKDECAKEYEELGLKELKELIKADRKTESNSEKPNNCEVKNYCDDCLYTDTCDSKEFFYACTSKATISKMEQVETMSCQECKHFHENAVMYLDQCDFCFKDCKYEPKDEPTISKMEQVKDEPQTDCAWK